MIVKTDAVILNCRAVQKKDNSGCYYLLDFLDDSDVSYQNFISKQLYDNILKQDMKRYDKAVVTLNLGKARTGTGFDIFVKDVEKIPFEEKKAK